MKKELHTTTVVWEGRAFQPTYQARNHLFLRFWVVSSHRDAWDSFAQHGKRKNEWVGRVRTNVCSHACVCSPAESLELSRWLEGLSLLLLLVRNSPVRSRSVGIPQVTFLRGNKRILSMGALGELTEVCNRSVRHLFGLVSGGIAKILVGGGPTRTTSQKFFSGGTMDDGVNSTSILTAATAAQWPQKTGRRRIVVNVVVGGESISIH